MIEYEAVNQAVLLADQQLLVLKEVAQKKVAQANERGREMTEPSAAAIIAAGEIETLDVLTLDGWTERRELTAHARSVIAFALDAFAAQTVAAERAKSVVSDLEQATGVINEWLDDNDRASWLDTEW